MMHLLYLDESGSASDPGQQYFVLAGVSVFEREAHWVEQGLNDVARRFAAADPYSVELHGSPMRSGNGAWRRHSKDDRLQAVKDALQVGVADRSSSNVRLFGAVIKKSAVAGQDPVELAFEQLTSRFDMFLKRLFHKHNDAQRGLILLDKSSTENRIQTLAREFKYDGHSWGRTKNYAEVPVCAPTNCLAQAPASHAAPDTRHGASIQHQFLAAWGCRRQGQLPINLKA
jgi:Protein of unknown function (DUF3800)